ncbi:hypothetical protein DsansV1_C20g0162901 [Dioscorea sansibarensis]
MLTSLFLNKNQIKISTFKQQEEQKPENEIKKPSPDPHHQAAIHPCAGAPSHPSYSPEEAATRPGSPKD